MGRGATKREFYRYEQGGEGEVSHAEGGHNKFWCSFYAVALGFSHIEGGMQKFSTL